MTETPTAAVAAPVAPVAPAAVVAAPVAPVVAPVAPAAPAEPPAAPAAPAVPPPIVEQPLIPTDTPAAPAAPAVPQTDAEKLAAAQELVKQAAAAADPNSGKAWLLADGVMGVGEKPSWFLADKYKNVTEQAKAYPELSKRFGSFTGAPKNEKGEVAYAFTPPEGFTFNPESAEGQAFAKWARENQLSQEGYAQLLGHLVDHERSKIQSPAEIIARIGENGPERVKQVAAWGKANLSEEAFSTFSEATKGPKGDVVIKAFEAIIGKTAQARMPKPGGDTPGGSGLEGLAAIQAAHRAKTPDGKIKVNVDPAYRQEIEKRYRDHFKAMEGQG